MLCISNLDKAFVTANAKIPIFSNLEMQLAHGESLAIMGPSGCGKSTLLHLIASLLPVDSGNITLHTITKTLSIEKLNETSANNFRRDLIGIVFQKFNLIEYISVIDNITLPALHKNNLDQAYIESLCNTLQISSLLFKYPAQLSGGEQQRVAIARALAHKPMLVLADEPTGNLDPKTSAIVADLLVDMCKDKQTSLIMVTHSPSIAAKCDRTLYLENQKLTSTSNF